MLKQSSVIVLAASAAVLFAGIAPVSAAEQKFITIGTGGVTLALEGGEPPGERPFVVRRRLGHLRVGSGRANVH